MFCHLKYDDFTTAQTVEIIFTQQHVCRQLTVTTTMLVVTTGPAVLVVTTYLTIIAILFLFPVTTKCSESCTWTLHRFHNFQTISRCVWETTEHMAVVSMEQ